MTVLMYEEEKRWNEDFSSECRVLLSRFWGHGGVGMMTWNTDRSSLVSECSMFDWAALVASRNLDSEKITSPYA